MQSLNQALVDLVRRNIITVQDALNKSSNPLKLQELLQAKGLVA
jgi:Tfp pilus assembly ATPase PilU